MEGKFLKAIVERPISRQHSVPPSVKHALYVLCPYSPCGRVCVCVCVCVCDSYHIEEHAVYAYKNSYFTKHSKIIFSNLSWAMKIISLNSPVT
jgi:hypothetical protein